MNSLLLTIQVCENLTIVQYLTKEFNFKFKGISLTLPIILSLTLSIM